VRSLRSRLLVTLLTLITFVVLVVSLYIYNEVENALDDRAKAAEVLLTSQFDERCARYDELFNDELYRQAWRLASQTRHRFEFSPMRRYQWLGLLSTLPGSAAPPVAPSWGWLAAHFDPVWRQRLYVKSGLDTLVLEPHLDEYFQISYDHRVVRSKNLSEECLALDAVERNQLAENQPIIKLTNMRCGKQLRFVTVKLPIVVAPGMTSMVWRRPPPNRGGPNSSEQRNNQRGDNRNSQRQPVPPNIPPMPPSTILVQVARELGDRDRALAEFQESYERDKQTVKAEAAQAKRDLLNRLVLIGIATIAGTALGITWISRQSLRPLVQVAEAVSNLSPKDLRLKINGREPKAENYPEELEPIIQRLQESLGSLEQAFAREKRATADISHELRTPLASLMTTAQVALRKSRTVEEYRTTLKQCVETGSHLTQLVERLLMLSRLDAGVDQLRKEPVDVVELAGQCVDMLRPLADPKGIEIELEVDESASTLEPVVGDAGKLREIFVNLIDNAVQYNKPEGHVAVRVAADRKAVILEVSDTGVGMTSQTRSHLFQRFFRADPSRQSDTVNAGLGLAIVKGYVDLFGGQIEVESELNVGSTFRITLPRVRANVPAPQPAY
jgi:heavy metal sensor kinase